MKDWAQLIENFERDIRDGRIAEARRRLTALSHAKVPREHLVRFAGLARRASLPQLGVRWLHRRVRARGRLHVPRTDEEILEYAACLTRLDLTDESLSLLATLDPEVVPRVDYEVAAAHICRWSYRESIPFLVRYAKRRSLKPYDRLVGRVNLAAALVYEREFRKATPLLRDLLHETSAGKHLLLLGVVLQFSALSFIAQKKTLEARRFLERAARYLIDPASLDAFFLAKWDAIVSLMETGPTAENQKKIIAIVAEGRRRGHWETPRDCDRLTAVFLGDHASLLRAYFGTPYPQYRARLIAEFGQAAQLSSHFVWFPGGPGKVEKILDLEKKTSGGKIEERALLTLCSDHYRPFRVTTLFAALYPDQFFQPDTSPNRIHQAMKQLRAWLKSHANGLSVLEEDGWYRLCAQPGWGIRMPGVIYTSGDEKPRRQLVALREAFPARLFNAREAAAVLNVSRRTALRVLNGGKDRGVLDRQGKRVGAKYRFR